MIRRRATDAICIAWLLLVTIATGHLILKTALAIPDLATQAVARDVNHPPVARGTTAARHPPCWNFPGLRAGAFSRGFIGWGRQTPPRAARTLPRKDPDPCRRP
jgi:hypothetical protein